MFRFFLLIIWLDFCCWNCSQIFVDVNWVMQSRTVHQWHLPRRGRGKSKVNKCWHHPTIIYHNFFNHWIFLWHLIWLVFTLLIGFECIIFNTDTLLTLFLFFFSKYIISEQDPLLLKLYVANPIMRWKDDKRWLEGRGRGVNFGQILVMSFVNKNYSLLTELCNNAIPFSSILNVYTVLVGCWIRIW